jgi:hypothetical protein
VHHVEQTDVLLAKEREEKKKKKEQEELERKAKEEAEKKNQDANAASNLPSLRQIHPPVLSSSSSSKGFY